MFKLNNITFSFFYFSSLLTKLMMNEPGSNYKNFLGFLGFIFTFIVTKLSTDYKIDYKNPWEIKSVP